MVLTLVQKYVADFEAIFTSVTEEVEPKSETTEQKIITERLYSTMNNLIAPFNRLTGYINMAREP